MWWLGVFRSKPSRKCCSCGKHEAVICIYCSRRQFFKEICDEQDRHIEDIRNQYMLSLGFDPIALGM